MSHYVTGFILDEGLGRYVEPLIQTGLYGDTESDVMVSLIREGIIKAVASKFVPVMGDLEIEEAPPQPPASRCSVCSDTLDFEGLPFKVCPKCGNDGIPF